MFHKESMEMPLTTKNLVRVTPTPHPARRWHRTILSTVTKA